MRQIFLEALGNVCKVNPSEDFSRVEHSAQLGPALETIGTQNALTKNKESAPSRPLRKSVSSSPVLVSLFANLIQTWSHLRRQNLS